MLLVELTSGTTWGCASLRKAAFLDAECSETMLMCMPYICMHADRHPHGELVRALSIHFVGVTIASRFADFHSSLTVSDSLRRDWSSIRPLSWD